MAAKRGRKPGVSKVDPDETKAQRFTRLASKRMTKIINGIESLGKLAGNGYESTPEQVAKMFGAIGKTAEYAYGRFQSKGEKASKEGFTF